MPRDGKKGKRRHGYLTTSDISLRDFADCAMPQACTRVKKSVMGATATNAVPKASGVQMLAAHEPEDLDWFDKDLDSFVVPDQGQEEEDLTVAEIAAERCDRNNKRMRDKRSKDEGIVYPADVWFHLSNFIDPVDVGRFASICLGSFAITKTASFWRHLYYRCYSRTNMKSKRDSLPGHLKPARIEKLNGLRARVIAALFYIYKPLIDYMQIQNKDPMDAEPHDLTGYRCLLAWHQPGSRGWQFCFKLQKPSLLPRRKTNKDLHNGYNDIFDNPEEGCVVLQVICCHFASVPPAMGLLLKQVYMTLSAGFRYHRLRLHFDTSISSGIASASEIVANLDDVIGVKVIQWWHPNYPFPP